MNNSIEYSGLYWMNILDFVLNWILNWIIFRPDSMKKWIFKAYRTGLLKWQSQNGFGVEVKLISFLTFTKPITKRHNCNGCLQWKGIVPSSERPMPPCFADHIRKQVFDWLHKHYKAALRKHFSLAGAFCICFYLLDVDRKCRLWMIWLIVRCSRKSSLFCQKKSDAL